MSALGDLARGAVAGAVGWCVMDAVLRTLHDREAPAARRAEDRARGGVPALEALAERMAATAGVRLSDGRRQRAGTALQWLVGIGAGALYGVLRPRLHVAGAARGLAYGVGFSLVVDEGLTPLLGLSPGPRAFPWQTHVRGLIGHLAFGLAADTALDIVGGARPAERR